MNALDQNGPEEAYIKITHRKGEIKTAIITRQEALSPNHEDIDFERNEVTRTTRIIPQTGEPLVYHGSVRGVGPTAWELLTLVMNFPGEYFQVGEIYHRTGNVTFADASSVQNVVRNLRKAFGESGEKPWFILSSNDPEYAVCWPIERSWMIIRKAQPGDDPKEQ